MKTTLVVTSINSPNDCLLALAEGARANNIDFILAGDTKSPKDFSLEGCTYLDIERQNNEFPKFSKLVPTKHYARKNIGYLKAIKDKADCILETDDDNFPLTEFWQVQEAPIAVDIIEHPSHWVNVYRFFSEEQVWPRGFPLERVQDSNPNTIRERKTTKKMIVQGLADENPDVDAVFRLTQPLPVKFKNRSAVAPNYFQWCPFNSQNTFFARECFPLLYLPSYCSFRMTDIWRSFIAQRCLWEMGARVIFTKATVYQKRNDHNLLKDFEDEIPGYLNNQKIVSVLSELKLDPNDMYRNLVFCYEALIGENFISKDELPLVNMWISSLEHCQ